MFPRVKRTGSYEYLQIVHNQRVDGHVRQRVVATLGRLDELRRTGQIDSLVTLLAQFTEHAAVLSAYREGDLSPVFAQRVGPDQVFARLWQEVGAPDVLGRLLEGRRFGFPVERAVYLTVLHRLFCSGSDRAADVWRDSYRIAGVGELHLHQIYRTMGWLGSPLPRDQQDGATGFSPRCVKDLVEEALFDRRRDLFTSLSLVFFDTTSIYFEGRGGASLGQHGISKDHRPDLKQMVVGAVLDSTGYPICCELWPGNTTDVKTLLPVVRRLRRRFHIQDICIVADRGMISAKVMEALREDTLNCRYILGARMRATRIVSDEVLSRGGRYQVVNGPRVGSADPSPLDVKEVRADGRRFIVCRNQEQARKDKADRQAIIDSLQEALRRGDKSLIGNNGYRKFLKKSGHRVFEIDEAKVRDEERFDGKWVLETDMDVAAEQVALRYKDLWMVEQVFRTCKTILETRPIFHRRDDTIRGHVFCSFLALLLVKTLYQRLEARGWTDVEWARLRDSLDNLQELTLQLQGKRFVVRTAPLGDAGKAFQAAGVALGPAIRQA